MRTLTQLTPWPDLCHWFRKRVKRDVSANLLSQQPVKEALPTAEILVNGIHMKVLIDTRCSQCIALASCCSSWKREAVSITVSGNEHLCKGTGVVSSTRQWGFS